MVYKIQNKTHKPTHDIAAIKITTTERNIELNEINLCY
jgi:hypothetical protein